MAIKRFKNNLVFLTKYDLEVTLSLSPESRGWDSDIFIGLKYFFMKNEKILFNPSALCLYIVSINTRVFKYGITTKTFYSSMEIINTY